MMIQRDKDMCTKTFSSKIICLSAPLLGFVCYSYYAADLTSLMTVSTKVSNVNSFDEAVEQGYHFLIWPGTNSEYYYMSAQPGSGQYKAYHEVILKDYENSQISSDQEAHLRITAEPKTLWFGSYLGFMADKRVLSLTEMQDRVVSQLAFGLQKDSEFKDVFDHLLLKMKQSGLLQKLAFQWLKGGEPDPMRLPYIEDAKKLGFDNLFFPVLVITCGVFISGIIVAAEVLYCSVVRCTRRACVFVRIVRMLVNSLMT